LILIPAAADQLTVPIVASGGFADGRGLVAALALGAEGINMGTRFCATQEAPIHPNIKQFYVDNDERATHLLYRQFRNTARVAKNAVSELVVKMSEDPGLEFEQIRSYVSGLKGKLALENGDVDGGVLSAGQALGAIHDIPTCQALIGNIRPHAEQRRCRRLARFFPPYIV